MSLPPRVALIGFMGSGKSTVGKILAEKIGYDFVDTDELVVQQAGAPIPRIFAERGEPAFRDLEAEVIQSLWNVTRAVIAVGGGAPAQPRNSQFFTSRAVTFYLPVSFETARARTRGDVGRPLLSRDDAAVRNLLSERLESYARLGQSVETDGCSPLEIAEEIIRRLRGPRPSPAPAETA